MNYAQEMKEAIKQRIEEVFGEINNYGSYAHNGEWVSTESVFNLGCSVIDENDYLFDED